MLKKLSLFIFLIFLFSTPLSNSKAAALSKKLSGRILLQVEQNGEAWFVSTENQNRYFLGRPDDAFNIIRELGLGISNADFDRFNNTMPDKLLGKILIKVEDSGKAYYIYPIDKKAYFLGRPQDAFNVMQELGLGITNLSLNKITEDESSKQRREQEQNQNETSNQNQGDNQENNNINDETTNNTKEATSTNKTETAETATTTPDTATTTNKIIGSENCEFLAEYFKKETISGAPNYTENVMGIDFDWGEGAPEMLGNFNNKFAVRYTGNCYFEEGTYKFSIFYNDGIEATLDNFWLAKSWKNRTATDTSVTTLKITEGYHRVKVEYYEHLGEASVGLDWMKIE